MDSHFTPGAGEDDCHGTPGYGGDATPGGEPKDEDDLDEKEMGDTTVQVNEMLKADKEMDQAFLGIVNTLQDYLVKSQELSDSIGELEEQLRKDVQRGLTPEEFKEKNKYIIARLNAQKMRKKQIDQQIVLLEAKSHVMMREQTKFKKTRDSLMKRYYERKGVHLEGQKQQEQDDENEINEEMKLIEEKLKEIEAFNARNFKVDKQLLNHFEQAFEDMDYEIVTAPFIEYTEANPPPYLPDASKWINIVVQAQQEKSLTQKDKEDLNSIQPLIQRAQTVVKKKR
ncbi:hypothetical protein FGO68_gene16164 [Halteria grandinella]|uniref:Uncharacterized protein n=1 Tax=Halteria grandinella TaxID=5974 RepID=A0A8J8T1T6_HALGN|nr:hypothetical protein FGO68_gene16164 [Halteria grandinella]